MHGLSRLGNGAGPNSPSPPSSHRFRHDRTKSSSVEVSEVAELVLNFGRGVWPVFFVVSAVYRRRVELLFAPLLYICGMLFYMGTLGFDVVVINGTTVRGDKVPPPGLIYRSPQVFERLWPFMEAEINQTSNLLMNVWNPKFHQSWKPCIKSVSQTGFSELSKSNGFLIIEANGSRFLLDCLKLLCCFNSKAVNGFACLLQRWLIG